jgi:hypothetical protein
VSAADDSVTVAGFVDPVDAGPVRTVAGGAGAFVGATGDPDARAFAEADHADLASLGPSLDGGAQL